MPPRQRPTDPRPAFLAALLVAGALLLAAAALLIGSGGLDLQVIVTLRAPRVTAAAGVGALLALSGFAMQVLLRNPLADPYVLGTSGGAGVGALLAKLDALSLANVRVVRHDAVEVVAGMIPMGALAGVHVFFPDPWPKKRHHKRRLLQPAFVHALAQRLAPGGYLHAATDWEDYAHEMLATFGAEPLLRNTSAGFSPRPATRPLTKFEARGQRLGHAVFDLVFERA